MNKEQPKTCPFCGAPIVEGFHQLKLKPMTNNNQDVLDEFEKERCKGTFTDISFNPDGHEEYTNWFAIEEFISQKLTERTKQILDAIPSGWDFAPSELTFLMSDTTALKDKLKSRFLDQEVGEKE